MDDARGGSAGEGPLSGGGEMGALLRGVDWSKTPLGPVEQWPQSLLTTVSTCLNSRFPILVWWGPELVKIYNDAYMPILGKKHPSALGARGREVWPEIWHIIGPMLEGVLSRGEATWSENIMLPLERRGSAEECYFTFSYSPVRVESGGIGGVFTAVYETTQQVLGERRLRLLRELAAATAGATDDDSVCKAAIDVLARDDKDVPAAALFLRSADGLRAGYRCGEVQPGEGAAADEVVRTGRELHTGRALLLPIVVQGDEHVAGVLVAALSPLLQLDEAYRGFLNLVASQIGNAIGSARALETARRRAEALAELDRAKTAFLQQREPRVPHAADAAARTHRGAATRRPAAGAP